MLSYYRGADPKGRAKDSNRNRILAKVETYLNNDLASRPDDGIYAYMSFSVVENIGEDSKIVHEIIAFTDGGSNGITVLKSDFEHASARRS
jgi:hypothetical protein